MIAAYRKWAKHRRAVKEARLLLREARRGLRRYSYRLTDKQALEVRGAIARLSELVTAREYPKLAAAVNGLDRALDDHLAFARKSALREYAESIAAMVLIALFLRAFVVEAFKIPSGSMIPTLQIGDHIFVNKFIYGIRIPLTNIKFGAAFRKPKRGEVIVFVYPREPDKDFIKRIVAVAGDTVEVKDDHLFVNGRPVERAHVEGDCRYMDYEELAERWEERRCEEWRETSGENSYTTVYDKNNGAHSSRAQTVPPNAVFVMGDNRDNSHDSRFWGFVPFDLIKGKAMVIWWSSGEPEGVRVGRMFDFVR